MNEIKRRRGRPRTFDTDVAMQSIVETFRARGYAATSLDDLSRATTLSRPSLYAAYGDKLDMYLSALDAFSAAAAKSALRALRDGRSVEESLRRFYEAMLDVYFGGADTACGCLVYGTAPGAVHEGAVREKLSAFVDELDRIMLRRLRDFPDATESRELKAAAEAAANALVGLSVRARSGASKRSLKAQARRSAHLIATALA